MYSAALADRRLENTTCASLLRGFRHPSLLSSSLRASLPFPTLVSIYIPRASQDGTHHWQARSQLLCKDPHLALPSSTASCKAAEEQCFVCPDQKKTPGWLTLRAQGDAIVDGQMKTISLSDYKGKYLVLFF